MVSRTFDGDIPFCFSLFVVRLRDEAASVSTGGILIIEISRGQRLGQQAELSPPRYVEASGEKHKGEVGVDLIPENVR
jgi:hypothetical protein